MRRCWIHTHINGKYNASKLAVLVTIWYFCTYKHFRGLTPREIEAFSGEKAAYLRCRLPMFVNSRKLWAHAYLKRRWIAKNGYPEYSYSLTAYGKRWLFDKADRPIVQAMADTLAPIWGRY